MNRILLILLIATSFISFVACSQDGKEEKKQSKTSSKEEALSLWNDNEVKAKIISFVDSITDKNSPHYLTPSNRVVMFDMDGTILAERPMYAIFDFALRELSSKIKKNPELKNKQPYKAVAEKDMGYFKKVGFASETGIYSVLLFASDGDSEIEYAKKVRNYFNTVKNKRFGVSNKKLVYKPTLQLIKYLQKNKFDIYISTGSEIQFARIINEDMIGIPAENIIGTTVLTKWVQTDSGAFHIRQHQFIQPINDKDGKPVNIKNKIGKQPIMVVGNSMGDYHMLEYSKQADYSLQIVINHDDADREYSYNAEEMKKACKENGWFEVSMKKDFKKVFEKK
ncbi:MAG: haloacid dehalogenase-like hydrolase [Ichthyobacteriaceae bacterium]|nr:haloacid dehalogenase-like hydrolase [Ichthyobacteriaceae bacterium]